MQKFALADNLEGPGHGQGFGLLQLGGFFPVHEASVVEFADNEVIGPASGEIGRRYR